MGEGSEEDEEGREGMQKRNRTLISPSPWEGSSSRSQLQCHFCGGSHSLLKPLVPFLWAFLCQGPQDGQQWASAFFSAARSSAPGGNPLCHTHLHVPRGWRAGPGEVLCSHLRREGVKERGEREERKFRDCRARRPATR